MNKNSINHLTNNPSTPAFVKPEPEPFTNTSQHIATSNVEIPVIDQIIDDVGTIQGIIQPGFNTDDTTPTVIGSGTPGNTIKIYDNGDPIGLVTVRNNGTWSFTPTTPLLDGEHLISITAISGETESAHSAPYPIIIDTQAPSRPNIKTVHDDHGSQTGYYSDGSVISDTKPTIYGYGEPHSTITIYDNGAEIGQAQADASGSWSFTPSGAMAEGAHQIILTASDTAGNESSMSAAFNFTVDSLAPEKPSIQVVLDNQGTQTGEVPSGGITDDNTPLVLGTAEPGSQITILLDDVVWDVIQANNTGNWEYTPSVPFPDGLHVLSVTATDQAGNTSEASDPFSFTINTNPAAISIDGATDNEGPYTGAITSGQATDDATPTLRGMTQPNALVKIYDGATLLGLTQANSAGVWFFTPSTALSEGQHQLTATVTVQGYEIARSDVFKINVDQTAPENWGLEVSDSSGNTVVNGGITLDSKPTLSGRGEPGAIISLTDNGIYLGESTVNEKGQWFFVPAQPLDEGLHEITVTITDEVGNSSAPSDAYTITIAASIPSEPVILAIIDDVGTSVGEIAQDGVTDDRRPTFQGTAKPGGTVFVFSHMENQPSILIGMASVDASGHWSLTPDYDLPLGNHTFYVQQGINSSSEPWTVTVILPPVPIPTIDTVYETLETANGVILSGDVTEDRTPLIVGKAEANSTVIIKNGEDIIGSVKADAHGHWSFTPTLDYGYNNLTAITEDNSGRQSEPSNVFSLGVLTTVTYDFESLTPKLYWPTELPWADGVLFKKLSGTSWFAQVLNLNGSKVGFSHNTGAIEIDWPEGAAAASFNLWSYYPKVAGTVTLTLYMDGTVVDVRTIEKMSGDFDDSLVTIHLESGRFDQIEIYHPAGDFLVDNIQIVRGGSNEQAGEAINLANQTIDATSFMLPQEEAEQSAVAVKHAALQLSASDLLEDGEKSFYVDDSKPLNNDGKHLKLDDLLDENGSLDTQDAQQEQLASDTNYPVEISTSQTLIQSGLEFETHNHA